MLEKVFLTEENQGKCLCPNCNLFMTVEATTYNKGGLLNVKCKCGHSFSVFVERRAGYRKNVELPGIYTYTSSDGKKERGTLFVIDISRNGLKFKVKVDPIFSVGDKIFLEFQLDNDQKTLIRKEVVVKRIVNDKTIGSEFCSVSPSDPNDKAIGFYLF